MRPVSKRQCEVTPERITNLNRYQNLTIIFCKQLCIKVAKTSIETKPQKISFYFRRKLDRSFHEWKKVIIWQKEDGKLKS